MQQGVTLKICNVHIGLTQHCDKMKYGGQIFAQATVGEAISLPPRGITACLVEWVIVWLCTNSPNKVHAWEAPLRGRMISSPTVAGEFHYTVPFIQPAKLQSHIFKKGNSFCVLDVV